MKRIDIALIVSGLAIMGASGFMTAMFPQASYWVSFVFLGTVQTLFGTTIMALRQIGTIDRKLSETEGN